MHCKEHCVLLRYGFLKFHGFVRGRNDRCWENVFDLEEDKWSEEFVACALLVKRTLTNQVDEKFTLRVRDVLARILTTRKAA